MHFLRCLPIQNDKIKILGYCLKHVIYWDSNEASVPNDLFYFILNRYELYNSSANSNRQNNDVIKEYIVNRCELYFKATLHKVIKNPDWVMNSTYFLSYKIPKIFHWIFYQIRTAKNFRKTKLLNCLLTLISVTWSKSKLKSTTCPPYWMDSLPYPCLDNFISDVLLSYILFLETLR